MVFAFAEGLIVRSMERTGLAFLNAVRCEVIEANLTSKGDRGLVRTRNTVRNAAGEDVLVYRPLRLGEVPRARLTSPASGRLNAAGKAPAWIREPGRLWWR